MLFASSEPPVQALGLNDFQDGVNIRKYRLEPEVLLAGDTIHAARTAMSGAYGMSQLQKNPADFVNVSFLKNLEDEGFFKKLSGSQVSENFGSFI